MHEPGRRDYSLRPGSRPGWVFVTSASPLTFLILSIVDWHSSAAPLFACCEYLSSPTAKNQKRANYNTHFSNEQVETSSIVVKTAVRAGKVLLINSSNSGEATHQVCHLSDRAQPISSSSCVSCLVPTAVVGQSVDYEDSLVVLACLVLAYLFSCYAHASSGTSTIAFCFRSLFL